MALVVVQARLYLYFIILDAPSMSNKYSMRKRLREFIYLYILLKKVEYFTVVYRIYLPNYCGTYLSEICTMYIYKYASLYHCEYYIVRNTLFQHSILLNKLFSFATVQLYYLTNKSIELNILLFGVICESDTIIIQHCIRSMHFSGNTIFYSQVPVAMPCHRY